MKMYLKEIPCINKVALPYPEGSDVTWRHGSAILNLIPQIPSFSKNIAFYSSRIFLDVNSVYSLRFVTFSFLLLWLIGPRFAFTISCFPSRSYMVAHIARDSLPSEADASLLHLNDPSCGVSYVTKKSVIIKAPLKGCGTLRNTYH